MTKIEKLNSRFLTRPKGFGYLELQGSGSRVVFFNQKLNHSIKLHKPHPGKILKRYQMNLVLDELKSKNLI